MTCETCQGEGEILSEEFWCCRLPLHRIECACGGRPQRDWILCPDCLGKGEVPDCPVIYPEPCKWQGKQEECPEHGIAAYYRRRAEEGRDSGD